MSTREEDAKDPRLFDSRIVERNIKKGLVTRKDYEKHLKALPDVSEKILPPTEQLAADLDDDDDYRDEIPEPAPAASDDDDDDIV